MNEDIKNELEETEEEEMVNSENFVDILGEAFFEQAKKQFKEIGKIEKVKSDKEQFQEIGMTVDQHILSLIRKPSGGLKQELKKLRKKGLITKDQEKEYKQYQKDFSERMLRDFPEFNQEAEEARLSDKLEKLKDRLLDNEDFNSTSFNAALTFSKDPFKTFTETATDIFTLAAEIQDKILELGSKDNPLIFSYFERVAIVAEQIFISLSYEFDKLALAVETKNYIASTMAFDLKKDNACLEIKNKMKASFAHFYYQSLLSPEKCFKKFNNKKNIHDFHKKLNDYLIEDSFEALEKISESKNDITIAKNTKTIINIQESFTNQFMYDTACITNKELEERAKSYSLETGEGKEAFIIVSKELKKSDMLSAENMAEELYISVEEAERLIKLHKDEI